jgi:hypothetical protein
MTDLAGLQAARYAPIKILKPHGFIHLVGRPREFHLKNVAEFLAYGFGDRKKDAAIFRRLEKLVGQACERKRGDVDIGVGGNSDHLAALPLFLPVFGY